MANINYKIVLKKNFSLINFNIYSIFKKSYIIINALVIIK